MKFLHPKRFQTKVLLYILGLIAFFVLVVWLLQIVFLENYYEYAKEKSIRKSADQIEEMIGRYRFEEIKDSLEELATDSNMCIELKDLYGNSQWVIDKAGDDCVIHNNQSLLVYQLMNLYRQEDDDEMIRTLTSHKNDINSCLLMRTVKDYYDHEYILSLTAPLTPVKATTDILRDQFKLIIIILIVVGVLLSLILSRSITKPIQNISKTAREISKGNLSVRAQVKGEDEISQMANDFNYMVDELNQVEHSRQALLANISHDLRTPLTMIQGYAETIKDITGDQPEKRNQQLDIIIRESQRLSLLVNDVLQFTTLQQNGYDLDITTFDISQVMQDIITRYRVITSNDQIHFFGEEHCYVQADQKRIEQVIYNLLNNAINHIGTDRQIFLLLVKEKESVKISVVDHGSGIPPEQLPFIWDRYYKVKHSGKRLEHGTGLGLSIVKAILEAHKAPFGVESRIGKGTTFWFELPLINKK